MSKQYPPVPPELYECIDMEIEHDGRTMRCVVRNAYRRGYMDGHADAENGTTIQLDVGEIVRCRHCRFYAIDPEPIDPGWPMMCERTGDDMVDPDCYCAWGEKSERANFPPDFYYA